MSERGWAFVLLGFFAVFFTLNMGGYNLWPADEPRYAEVAREMIVSGNYLTPHVNGERYQEKPPLLFWAMAAASLPFGGITEWSARLPSAVSAVGVLGLVFLIARRWFGDQVALWAMVILATNARFWWQARTGQIDMLLTLCMMAALYAMTRWHTDRRMSWIVLFYGAIAAGTLAKGPPAFMFPMLCAVAFYWKDKPARKGLHLILGSIAVWAIFFAWYAPAHMFAPAEEAARGLTATESIYRNTIGRIQGVSKADYPWAYVFSIPTDLLPWGLLLPWTLPWAWRRRKSDDGIRLMLCWILPAFIVFSIIIGKRAIYLMPLMPVFAILISASVAHLVVADRTRWRRNTLLIWGGALIILGLAPLAIPFTEYARFFNGGIVLFSLVCLGAGIATVGYARTSNGAALPRYLGATFGIVASLAATFVLPTVNMEKGSKSFCAPVREAARAGEINLYSLAFSREEYILYSEHFHEPLFTDVLIDDTNRDKDPMKVGMVQRAAQKAIGEAVSKVPIVNLDKPTDEELLLLKKAVDDLIDEGGFEAGNVRSVRNTLEHALEELDKKFATSTPTFAFVQSEDWRWMIALRPALRLYSVIQHRPVGSRDMLLIGNRAATG